MPHQHKVHVAIFASGSGSNAKALIEFSRKNEAAYEVIVIVSNKEFAGVRTVSEQYGIPFEYVADSGNGPAMISLLQKYDVDIIALGGYMRLLPPELVKAYSSRIINIHPSLLPNYGGKGMYGMNVHMAVYKDKLPFTGITIHIVDEEYDRGLSLVQAKVDIADCTSPEAISAKVKTIEHLIYPMVLHEMCKRIYSQT